MGVGEGVGERDGVGVGVGEGEGVGVGVGEGTIVAAGQLLLISIVPTWLMQIFLFFWFKQLVKCFPGIQSLISDTFNLTLFRTCFSAQ